MASLTLRHIDEELKIRLQRQALSHGRSLQQEAGVILRQAIEPESRELNFAERIHQHFVDLDGDDLLIPQRSSHIHI